MAPPVQMVQSIRHDQLVSNMNANCTFQSKWGLSEFLQSRRLLADEAAGCSKWKTTDGLPTQSKLDKRAHSFRFSR
ncbi:uncharacterized protein LOC144008050 isoform X4 [Festucalex cinctus]